MKIKVFSAPELHEALALVREEMGPDALILDRHKCGNEGGHNVWHVHAARDIAPEEVSTPGTGRLESTTRQLEHIVRQLGKQEADRLRATLPNPKVQRAFDTLVRLGVAPAYAVEIASEFSDKQPIGKTLLHWGEVFNPKEHREIVLLTGPGGGGKTTLAAKIATRFRIKGIEVAFLSTDTERIGGLSALQTYADVLAAPLIPIRNKSDVQHALKKTTSARLVLVDSEGWTNSRPAALKRQSGIWQQLPSCTRRFVVMPANMDEVDGMETLVQAQRMDITELALSKLDETVRPGKLINWMATGATISYCSFGPEVPDSMGWLSAKVLTAMLTSHAETWET